MDQQTALTLTNLNQRIDSLRRVPESQRQGYIALEVWERVRSQTIQETLERDPSAFDAEIDALERRLFGDHDAGND